jgi:DNA-binding winged helix-turn-helix (wHTH) protein/tetratricopeptide (TPR) repeat protein/TolB-like protein
MVVQDPRETGQREVLRFGPFEANLHEWELRRNGRAVRLQGQPFQILALLLARRGELVTREQLRRELWPDHTFVDFDRGLNKAVNKLRNALCDDAEHPRYIATIPRHGYRLIAPVVAAVSAPAGPAARSRPTAPGVPATSPATSPAAPASAPAAVPGASAPLDPWRRPSPALRLALPRGRRAGWAAAILLGVCGAGGLGLARWRFGRGAHPPGPPPRLAVAVLGFRDLSAQPRAAWLATALSEWLTTELAAGHQLRLVPQQGVARMRAELRLPLGESLTAGSLARVRADCGADIVVAGAYALLGGRSVGPMRLDIVVQDTRTGATLLALHQSGAATHLLSLVARAGARLRAGLGVRPVTAMQAAEVRRALPAAPAAARDYAEGLAHLRVFDAIAARRWLRRAVAADPDNAVAHSALSAAWRILGYDHKALAEAAQALRLSAELSRRQRLLIQARYDELSRHWRRAITIYRALCQFFPDNVEYALALAHARTRAGQGRLALAGLSALTRRARIGAPPPDPRLALAVAAAQESLGEYAAMRRAAEQAAAQARRNGASLLLARAWSDEAWADDNLGELSAGITAATRAQRRYAAGGDSDGVAAALTLEAIGASDEGHAQQALAIFRRAWAVYQRTGRQDSIAAEWNNIGSTEQTLGRPAAAAAYFRRARRIYRAVQHPDGVALTTANLGFARLSAGDTAQARGDFSSALAICRKVGDWSKAALAQSGLAEAALRQHRYADASRRAHRALAAYRSIGDRRSAAALELLLARIDLRLRRRRETASLAAAAGSELRREGVVPGQAEAAALQAQVAWSGGHPAAAARWLARAQGLLARQRDISEQIYVARVAARVVCGRCAAARALAAVRLRALARRAEQMGMSWQARRSRRVLASLLTVPLAAGKPRGAEPR